MVFTRYNGNGIPFDKYETIFSANGQVVEVNEYEVVSKEPLRFELKSKKLNTFDAKGRAVETSMSYYSRSKGTSIDKYSDYDSYGNWTKRTNPSTLNFGLFSTPQLRKIEYYD